MAEDSEDAPSPSPDAGAARIRKEDLDQPSPQQVLRRSWQLATAPVRFATRELAHAASDAPLKVANKVSHLARATSDGVSTVAKNSVAFAKSTALEIAPLRKKSRLRRDDDVTEADERDDDHDEEGEEEGENGDDTATTASDATLASHMSLTFVVATSRQLQWLTLGTLLLALVATVFYWNMVVQNQWPTSLVILWFLAAFFGGRTVEAFLAQHQSLFATSITSGGKGGGHKRVRVSKQKPTSKTSSKKFTPRTVLSASNKYLKQVECNEEIRANLMNRLLQNPVYPHKKVLCDGDDMSTSKGPLIAKAVEPICTLRGMDAFLMESAEEDIASHPFLVTNGLRDVPTFMVNLVAQWGNLALYFELPSWFESWDSLCEDANDPTDVKALKRFLSSDDEYRTHRIRMLPSVVEGPLPIRVLAPPKKEISVDGKGLPCSWKKLEAEVTSEGKRLAPLLELEVDLVTSRATRGIANLVKRYLPSISVDVAIVLQKPDGQVEEEPEACLCLWRFHHLDVTGCPPLPDRNDVLDRNDQWHPDVLRASKFVRMTPEEISQLSME